MYVFVVHAHKLKWKLSRLKSSWENNSIEFYMIRIYWISIKRNLLLSLGALPYFPQVQRREVLFCVECYKLPRSRHDYAMVFWKERIRRIYKLAIYLIMISFLGVYYFLDVRFFRFFSDIVSNHQCKHSGAFGQACNCNNMRIFPFLGLCVHLSACFQISYSSDNIRSIINH